MINIVTYRTAEVNFDCIKGDSINQLVQFIDEDTNQPVNLSAYTAAKMQLRESELNANVVFQFTSTGATNQLILSQSNIGIITIKSPTVNINPQTYLYDLQLSNNTTIETIAKGTINIIQDITI